MDVITMQAVNKVLRRMNAEYGGMYEAKIATEGQDTFGTTDAFSMNDDHTLHVYVDGALAVEDTDYTKLDSKTVKFTNPLHAGEVVLFTTELAGSPKYANPPYDDTAVRSSITNLNTAVLAAQNAITAIKTAIDEDGDGSIVDTIADIKTQWQAADSTLQGLIANKVDTAVTDAIIAEITGARSGKATLKERLDEIVAMASVGYDDTQVKTDIVNLNNEIVDARGTSATLTDRLAVIVSSIPTAYDDTTITQSVNNLSKDMTDLNNEIVAARDGKATLLEKLQDLGTKITNIVTALDADSDGSIIDTIADIKTQWEAADSTLQGLIDNKANTSTVTAISDEVSAAREGKTSLKDKIDEIVGSIAPAYNDTQVKSDIKNVSDEVVAARNGKASLKEEIDAIVGSIPAPTTPYDDTALAGRVTALEGKTLSSFITVDTVTGYEYVLVVTNGSISNELTDSGKVAKGKDDLSLGDISAITSNLTLPTTIDGCNVSWATSDPTVIATDGTIARPANGSGNATVTLTATISLNAVSQTKDFVVTVLEQTP